jgi:DNA-binding NtrC family response regulator
MTMSAILIVDDEQDMLALLKRIISDKTTHEIDAVDNPLKVGELLRNKTYDVILTDLKMPGKNGIQILEEVKRESPNTAVIIMTAYGTIDSAIDATRKGAFDYITKPFRKERILHIVDQALSWQRLNEENIYLRRKLEEKSRFPALVGSSASMRQLLNQIEKVAKTSATVLITGESGTGKELVAGALHSHSLRHDQQFIPIDCSTIPESIIESELFGHMRGAFTGAIKDKRGLVQDADSGTLFLDEIGDLNLSMQVKLLRLLQEGEYKPVGSNAIRKVDIRFLAATNQRLGDKIKKGEFREDLFYRLNVINIHLPPLRERRDDIPVLASHFLEKYNKQYGKEIKRISAQVMNYFVGRDWPGNVRELENAIERGVIMSSEDVLNLEDIGIPERTSDDAEYSQLPPSTDIFSMTFKDAKDKLLERFQSEYISNVLSRNEGNVSQAARQSGLKRQYLHKLMREINIESKSFKRQQDD